MTVLLHNLMHASATQRLTCPNFLKWTNISFLYKKYIIRIIIYEISYIEYSPFNVKRRLVRPFLMKGMKNVNLYDLRYFNITLVNLGEKYPSLSVS